MEERLDEVLAAYDFTVDHICRTRGAYLLFTNQGLKLCKLAALSLSQIEFEQQVKVMLTEHGYGQVDRYVKNKEGGYLTDGPMGEVYLVKDWFSGTECNVKEWKDVKEASGNLGLLHTWMVMDREERPEWSNQGDSIRDILVKHNRELIRVYRYMKKKKQKNSFEVLLLNLFPEFYEQAQEAVRQLEQESACLDFEQKSREEGRICHGSYTYHNVLFTREGIATTNFEGCQMGTQVLDLYYFLRKVMEKHDWNPKIGMMILEEYNKKKTLTEEERKLLYFLILYPEKFWKIANFYYNKKKSWIPQRNEEKLLKVHKQMQDKLSFSGKLLYNEK